MSASAFADLVFVRHDRAVSLLLFFDVLSPFDQTLKEQLATVVAKRMAS